VSAWPKQTDAISKQTLGTIAITIL
jgi:hypothetical protein